MDSLVTTEWLEDHLGEPDLVVLDCSVVQLPTGPEGLRFASGRADYDAGHIPTAGFADLTSELSDPKSPLKYALPSPERFCEAMGTLGVGDQSRVVLYDGSIAAWAARVWWMLRWVGFDRAAILDGGMRAWVAEGQPISTEPTPASPRELAAAPRAELVATRDEVLAAIENDQVCILDAMPAAHFRGEQTMYERTGHVPGAINRPVRDLLDESGRFRPLAQLAALHPAELSVVRIGNSLPAPVFRVESRPNDWQKAARSTASSTPKRPWTIAHQALESLPQGGWTTIGEIAQLVRTSPNGG